MCSLCPRLVSRMLLAAGLALLSGAAASGQEAGRTASPPPPPGTLLAADRVTERRAALGRLRAAEGAGDLAAVAELNAGLAHESWARALRVAVAWEQLRDAETGLIPRDQKDPFWNGEDTGSDCLPFLFLACQELQPSRAAMWLEAIRTDRKLCGVLPKRVRFRPTRVEEIPLQEQLFGGAEYIKDGLLAMTERLGRGPWYGRMEEIAGELIAKAPQKTKRGPLPGNDTEINGDLLIFLPRLYWATTNAAYLEMARRIADVYLLDVMPAHGNLPALYWDFEKHRPTGHPHADLVKYRDHGNEIIFGLTELYFLERRLGLPHAGRHRLPLQTMLDTMLVTGRAENGLWYDAVKVSTGEVKKRVVDAWGYLLNALQTFDLAEGTGRYAAEIRRAMLGASQLKSFGWEGRRPDGYADALESMMYLLPWFDLPEGRAWLDDEMEVLFGFQQPDGFVEGLYLDGNFIRTALLYARYKTQGVVAEPWRDDLRLGAARDPRTGALVLHVRSAEPWKGVLKFDRPRHREIWGMPLNYPRINAPSEWFVAPADARFALSVSGADAREVTGASLVAGVPLELGANAPRQVTVSPAIPAP